MKILHPPSTPFFADTFSPKENKTDMTPNDRMITLLGILNDTIQDLRAQLALADQTQKGLQRVIADDSDQIAALRVEVADGIRAINKFRQLLSDAQLQLSEERAISRTLLGNALRQGMYFPQESEAARQQEQQEQDAVAYHTYADDGGACLIPTGEGVEVVPLSETGGAV